MDQFVKVAGYALLFVMFGAAVLLLLHYAGIIVATSVAGLWAFVWAPVAVTVTGIFVIWIFDQI